MEANNSCIEITYNYDRSHSNSAGSGPFYNDDGGHYSKSGSEYHQNSGNGYHVDDSNQSHNHQNHSYGGFFYNGGHNANSGSEYQQNSGNGYPVGGSNQSRNHQNHSYGGFYYNNGGHNSYGGSEYQQNRGNGYHVGGSNQSRNQQNHSYGESSRHQDFNVHSSNHDGNISVNDENYHTWDAYRYNRNGASERNKTRIRSHSYNERDLSPTYGAQCEENGCKENDYFDTNNVKVVREIAVESDSESDQSQASSHVRSHSLPRVTNTAPSGHERHYTSTLNTQLPSPHNNQMPGRVKYGGETRRPDDRNKIMKRMKDDIMIERKMVEKIGTDRKREIERRWDEKMIERREQERRRSRSRFEQHMQWWQSQQGQQDGQKTWQNGDKTYSNPERNQREQHVAKGGNYHELKSIQQNGRNVKNPRNGGFFQTGELDVDRMKRENVNQSVHENNQLKSRSASGGRFDSSYHGNMHGYRGIQCKLCRGRDDGSHGNTHHSYHSNREHSNHSNTDRCYHGNRGHSYHGNTDRGRHGNDDFPQPMRSCTGRETWKNGRKGQDSPDRGGFEWNEKNGEINRDSSYSYNINDRQSKNGKVSFETMRSLESTGGKSVASSGYLSFKSDHNETDGSSSPQDIGTSPYRIRSSSVPRHHASPQQTRPNTHRTKYNDSSSPHNLRSSSQEMTSSPQRKRPSSVPRHHASPTDIRPNTAHRHQTSPHEMRADYNEMTMTSHDESSEGSLDEYSPGFHGNVSHKPPTSGLFHRRPTSFHGNHEIQDGRQWRVKIKPSHDRNRYETHGNMYQNHGNPRQQERPMRRSQSLRVTAGHVTSSRDGLSCRPIGEKLQITFSPHTPLGRSKSVHEHHMGQNSANRGCSGSVSQSGGRILTCVEIDGADPRPGVIRIHHRSDGGSTSKPPAYHHVIYNQSPSPPEISTSPQDSRPQPRHIRHHSLPPLWSPHEIRPQPFHHKQEFQTSLPLSSPQEIRSTSCSPRDFQPLWTTNPGAVFKSRSAQNLTNYSSANKYAADCAIGRILTPEEERSEVRLGRSQSETRADVSGRLRRSKSSDLTERVSQMQQEVENSLLHNGGALKRTISLDGRNDSLNLQPLQANNTDRSIDDRGYHDNSLSQQPLQCYDRDGGADDGDYDLSCEGSKLRRKLSHIQHRLGLALGSWDRQTGAVRNRRVKHSISRDKSRSLDSSGYGSDRAELGQVTRQKLGQVNREKLGQRSLHQGQTRRSKEEGQIRSQKLGEVSRSREAGQVKRSPGSSMQRSFSLDLKRKSEINDIKSKMAASDLDPVSIDIRIDNEIRADEQRNVKVAQRVFVDGVPLVDSRGTSGQTQKHAAYSRYSRYRYPQKTAATPSVQIENYVNGKPVNDAKNVQCSTEGSETSKIKPDIHIENIIKTPEKKEKVKKTTKTPRMSTVQVNDTSRNSAKDEHFRNAENILSRKASDHYKQIRDKTKRKDNKSDKNLDRKPKPEEKKSKEHLTEHNDSLSEQARIWSEIMDTADDDVIYV